jgi:hypothetical protein
MLAPIQAQMLEVIVAVKSLKTTDVVGESDMAMRSLLLKESAMMALFDHANIVRVVGVVTVPVNVPPLLLLE